MSAAATRDDLAAVVAALTDQAAVQRQWQAEYETNAAASSRAAAAATDDLIEYGRHKGVQAINERFAAQARGAATAYEVSADMINKYVGVAR